MPSVSYRWAQPVVSRICEVEPRNIPFCLEPNRATLHYVALCIRGWSLGRERLGDIEWLAVRISRDARRTLLREIWRADLGSPRLLSHCYGGVWPAMRYDQLSDVLRDPNLRQTLSRRARWTPREFAEIVEAPASLTRFISSAVVQRLGLSATAYVVAGLLKHVPNMTESEAYKRLSPSKDPADVVKIITDIVLDVSAPEPPWPGSSEIRPLLSVRELREAARRFHNCLADDQIAVRLLSGDLVIYVAETPKGPVCCSLKHDRVLKSWRLTQVQGVKNTVPSRAISKEIHRAFAALGFPYLPDSPLGYWFDR